MDSTPPLSSIRLMIPPVRLISACMWQIAQEQHVEHYEYLENFVTLVTKMAPDVLSQKQRNTLITGLRAKVLLEMCRGDVPVDSQTVKNRLHQMQPTDSLKSKHSEMDHFQSNLLRLILNLLEDPAKKKDFFQRVYPVEYGPDFDKALQVLVCYFISRLDQLLPLPNFKQVALWMNSTCVWDECKQYICQTEDLQHLLQQNRHRPLDRNALPSIVEERIISALSLPPAVDTPHTQSIFQRECTVNTLSYSSQMRQEKQQTQRIHQNSQGAHTTSHASRAELEQCDSLNEDKAQRDLRHSEESESETAGGAHSDEAVTLKTIQTLPSQASPKQTSPLVRSGISSNRQDNNKGSLKEPSQDVADTHVAIRSRGKVHLPAGQAKSSLSQRGQKKCPHCSRGFAYYSDLLRHQRQCPQRLQFRKAPTYSCKDCETTFDSLNALRQHQKVHSRRPLECSHCGQTFERLCGLMSHLLSHQEDPSDSSPTIDSSLPLTAPSISPEETETLETEEEAAAAAKISETQCHFCGLNFFSTLDLKNHLMTHTELKPYRCSHCDKSFAAKINLISHMGKHTGEKPFLCETCGKSYHSAPQFKAHVRLHSSRGKKLSCPYCDKMLSTVGNLRVHIRIHTGERPYACGTCGKTFKCAGTLQVHTRCHTGERPYKCQVCDKGFVNSSQRNWHMRMHTGERPHSCHVCGKRFMRRECWKKHMLIHTGERNFKCPQCPSSYKRKSHLDVHIKKHKY